jgi:hypothetical protein
MTASPVWLTHAFAIVMIAVSAYCIGRIVLAVSLGRRNRYDVTVAHALMGLGMVGMLVRGWTAVPDGLGVAVFAALAGYFLVRAVSLARTYLPVGGGVHRVVHALVHMVMALTMLYMYWLIAAEPVRLPVRAMVGPPRGAGDPSLTLVLMVVLVASAIWELDATGRFASLHVVTPAATPAGTSTAVVTTHLDTERWLAPRLEAWCHIAMCVTMAYMLAVMV